MPKPKTVSEYISKAPKEVQVRLRQMQKAIKASAPKSLEGIKWSMISYSYSRILVMFAYFKNHIGFFPTPSAIKTFSKDLKKYKTSKGTIQFPNDKPIPIGLIKKIVKFRVNESKERDVKWKGK
jgi:uncharacterized protein YdhG (YjbR/CyaY superfamily)